MRPDSVQYRSGHGSKGIDSYHAGFVVFYYRPAGCRI